MEPPLRGFQELEKAFASHPSAFERPLMRNTSRAASTTIPAVHVDIPGDYDSDTVSSSTSDGVSLQSEDNPGKQSSLQHHLSPPLHALDCHGSGLPPTPPIIPTSDLDTDPAKVQSPVSPPPTFFADPVRNALTTLTSGLSTPLVEHQSPPTPDPSPPGTRGSLRPSRPPLSHYASSYADSFKTAKESLGGETSKSPLASHISSTPDASVATSMPIVSQSMGLGLANAALAFSLCEEDLDDARTVRPKIYVKDPDSSDHVTTLSLLAGEQHDDVEEFAVFPSAQQGARAPSQRVAVRKVRAVSQPGNDLKPKVHLHPWHLRAASDSKTNQAHNRSATLAEPTLDFASPFADASPRTDASGVHHVPRHKLYESSDVEHDRTPTFPFPNATVRQSLEGNNLVYKLIQTENVKRHSGISDGSIAAVVVPVSTPKPHLRHAPKLESLRAEINSTPRDSKRSSVDSAHILRHKQRMSILSASEISQSSPDASTSLPSTARLDRNDVVSARGDAPIKSMSPGTALADASSSDRTRRGGETQRSIPGLPQMHVLKTRGSESRSAKRIASQPQPAIPPLASWQQGPSPSPRLRHFSHERRLENNRQLERPTRADLPSQQMTAMPQMELPTPRQTLEPTEQSLSARFTPLQGPQVPSDRNSMPTSPKRYSLDMRSLNLADPSMSASQLSYRTDVELCEARGVKLFPHNNESVVMIQQSQAYKPNDNRVDDDSTDDPNETNDPHDNTKNDDNEYDVDDDDDDSDNIHLPGGFRPAIYPPSLHCAPPSTPPPRITNTFPLPFGHAKHFVDSPLTNPRAAPAPPLITFIPPTPVPDPDGLLVTHATEPPSRPSRAPDTTPTRQLSLRQRVRLYSEGLIQPISYNLGLSRSNKSRHVRSASARRAEPSDRPTHLSSFWQPRDFWEDYDSDDSSSFDDDHPDSYEPLPPGGDTSNLGHDLDFPATAAASTSLRTAFATFPRSMSVRMPGFRGSGGFLIGNSIGIDRHGSNNRRHYISVRRLSRPRVVAKRASLGQALERRESLTLGPALRPPPRSTSAPSPPASKTSSRSSHRPSSSLTRFRARLQAARNKRTERRREDRRDRLREKIGPRMYHIHASGAFHA